MSDQRIVGLGLLRDVAQFGFDVGLGRVGAEQRFDFRVRLGGLQNLVDVLGPAGEALLVFGLAAETGDGEVKRFGAQRRPQRSVTELR